MIEGDDRLTRLDARVRWLDRYRRTVAISFAGALAPIIWFSLSPAWPRAHGIALVIALAVTAWWISEVVLGVVLSAWETEANMIARDKGLPRATVVVRDVRNDGSPPSGGLPG
jgi:hypothetical protein